MKFFLFTPNRRYEPLECDSVVLNVADSSEGKFSGSYGIRNGHAKAIFALAAGRISVCLKGKEIFSAESLDGFATVENDEIRVTVDAVRQAVND